MGEKLIMVSGDLNPGQSNEPGVGPDKECLGAQEDGEQEGGSPHLSRWWETGCDSRLSTVLANLNCADEGWG